MRQKYFKLPSHIRNEYVLQVSGRVRARPEGTVNPDLTNRPSRSIGVIAGSFKRIRNSCHFSLDDEDVHEENRLRYRYVDLRRPFMQQRIRTKANVARVITRGFLTISMDFIDIETPILTKATPEGARDYLVPSRTQARIHFLPCRNLRSYLNNYADDEWV